MDSEAAWGPAEGAGLGAGNTGPQSHLEHVLSLTKPSWNTADTWSPGAAGSGGGIRFSVLFCAF